MRLCMREAAFTTSKLQRCCNQTNSSVNPGGIEKGPHRSSLEVEPLPGPVATSAGKAGTCLLHIIHTPESLCWELWGVPSSAWIAVLYVLQQRGFSKAFTVRCCSVLGKETTWSWFDIAGFGLAQPLSLLYQDLRPDYSNDGRIGRA